MKKYAVLITVFIAVILTFSTCKVNDILVSRETSSDAVASGNQFAADIPVNPVPEEVSAANLEKAKTFSEILKTMGMSTLLGPEPTASATLTPSSVSATLKPGESITEDKTAFLPADVTPPKADVLFTFDLTGSMGDELTNVQDNSIEIMNAVRGIIPDTGFGVVSHMDYTGTYGTLPDSLDNCGYHATYGSDYYGDYPYFLDQSITSDSDLTPVGSVIDGLELGSGHDGPEDYTRVFYESYADPGVGWRTGAKKIVIAWLDSIPHDCDVAGILYPDYDLEVSTGKDPGRDEVLNTEDDLAILNVLNEMAANNITLIVLYSGSSYYGWYFPLWEKYTEITGGEAFQINTDGTIPDGTDIATYVAGLLEESVSIIDNLTLEVCDPAYDEWLVSVDPSSYGPIDLIEDKSFDFDIEIMVPEGTEKGIYEFDICLIGDGAEYARQNVSITVIADINAPLDIKPTSCPNPLNTKSNGVLPVAINGTNSFDISLIDPDSITLEGVAPLRWAMEDVSAPYYPFVDKPTDIFSCSEEGPDGFIDMTFKFSHREVVAALGPVEDGDVLTLYMTGQLFDGTVIHGEDVVKIIKKK